MTDFSGEVPEGMMRTSEGKIVRAADVYPRFILEDQVVNDLVARADELHAAIVAFKQACFDDIEAFRTLMFERYRVGMGGRRGGLNLRSYDDRLRVEVSTADSLSFGPELEAAKALIDECLEDWSRGAHASLRTVVSDAFHVGEGKKIRMDRVLGLRRLDIDDPRWKRAMEAIGDAVRKDHSKAYVRLYRRDTPEKDFEQIVLDVSRA